MSDETVTLVRIAETEFQMNGPYLGELREANELLDDPASLQTRMLEDGFLLLRGLQDRETVLNARGAILEHLSAAGTLDPNSDPIEAVIAPDKGPRGGFRGAVDELANSPSISAVARSPEIMGFFEKFLGGPVLTLDYRWLRIVGSGGFTGCHYDVVYMGRGTKSLYTSWCPLGDVSLELGGLAVCVGSHLWDEVKESYGRMDVDRDRAEGWFTKDPMELVEKFGGRWHTTAFSAGAGRARVDPSRKPAANGVCKPLAKVTRRGPDILPGGAMHECGDAALATWRQRKTPRSHCEPHRPAGTRD